MKYETRQKPSKRNKRLKKQTLKRLTIGLLVLALLGGTWLLVVVLNAPSKGHKVKVTIKVPASFQTATFKPDTTQAPPVDNTYYGLMLPIGYNVQNRTGKFPDGILYIQNILGTSSGGSQILAIEITSSSGGLENNSAYSLRILSTSHYTKSSETIDGQNITIFTDKQTANIVAFWLHGGYIATISVSSAYQNQTTTSGPNPEVKVLNSFLNNWKWKN
jgi:hypothetical protein